MPHSHGYENAVMADDEAIKDHIEVAVKHFILKERERIKEEIVQDAMFDIRHELHSKYVSEDEISRGGTARKPRRNSAFEKSSRGTIVKVEELPERDSQTDLHKKRSRRSKKDVDTSHHHSRSKSHERKKAARKAKDTSHHHRKSSASQIDTSHHKDPKRYNTDTSHHHRKPRSKSREGMSVKSENQPDLTLKSSKRSYEFDFGSEDEKIAAARAAKKSSKENRSRETSKERSKTVLVKVEKTPKKSHKRTKPEDYETFTFSRRQNDNKDELNALYDQMKDFELQVVSMIRNLKSDLEKRCRLLEDKVKFLEKPNDDYQSVRNELEYIKGLNEALEEERKKDILRNKKYVEEKAQELFLELEHQRIADQKEIDKKLQQLKFDQQELLMESTDNHKREMRELKYSVEKNTEDFEALAGTIKSLKRRNEDISDSSRLKKSDSQLSTSITQKVDDKLEDKLKRLKDELRNEIKKQNEDYIDECIEYNNKNFVVPTVERQ